MTGGTPWYRRLVFALRHIGIRQERHNTDGVSVLDFSYELAFSYTASAAWNSLPLNAALRGRLLYVVYRM